MSVKSLFASQLHQSHYKPRPRPADSHSKLSVVIVLLRNALCMNFLLIFLFNLINNHGEGHVLAVSPAGDIRTMERGTLTLLKFILIMSTLRELITPE